MKHYKFIAAVGMLALASTVCLLAQADSAANSVMEAKNQQLVMNWYREVVAYGHVELASKYMAEDFVEHNPNYSGGRAEFVAHVGKSPAQPMQAALPMKPDRVFTKGDYVVIVWELDGQEKTGKKFKYNMFDIIRVQNGKVQEHWDGDSKNP